MNFIIFLILTRSALLKKAEKVKNYEKNEISTTNEEQNLYKCLDYKHKKSRTCKIKRDKGLTPRYIRTTTCLRMIQCRISCATSRDQKKWEH